MTRGTTSTSPRLLVAALALLLLSVLALPGSARSAFPGANGKIAFSSLRDGNFEIYTMNADGSGQTRLTNATGSDINPTWSPDGTKIAFNSDRTGNNEIFTMNADGSGQTNITNNAAADLLPAWSPDGTKIALATDRGGNFEIFTMNADGSGQTNLTNFPTASSLSPAWSPDGTKIAFERSLAIGSSDIYTMNADGSGQTNITNSAAANNLSPDWSPDGTKIAFSRNYEIYTMNADGSGQTNISNNNPALNFSPVWSPDGTKIAFTSLVGANYEIYTMNADGSGQTNVSNNPSYDNAPDWQPLTVTPTPPLDHFKTYETDLGKPKFSKRTVTLADAFGSSQVSVSEQRWTANPVDKNGEGINSRDHHFKCYSISDKRKYREQKITIANQFGPQRLEVETPKRLCVPASIGLANQTPPAPLPGLDHYKCYEAEGKKLNRSVTLTDEFVAGDQVVVYEPEYLCNPAIKNNEGPLVRPNDLLVCYELSKLDKFSKRKVSLRDQFGTQTVEVKVPEKLCVPSTKPASTPGN